MNKLRFIGTYADRIRAADMHELLRTQESLFLHKTCELSVLTCIERRESGRCVYRRTDYPGLNSEMNKPIVIWQEAGQFHFSWGRT